MLRAFDFYHAALSLEWESTGYECTNVRPKILDPGTLPADCEFTVDEFTDLGLRFLDDATQTYFFQKLSEAI